MPKKEKLRTFKTLKEFRKDKCIPGTSKGWSKAELISFAVTNKLDVPGGINNANKTALCSAIENHFTGKNLPPVLSGPPPTIAKIKNVCTDLGVEWNYKWRKADYVRECWEKRKMVENVAKEILEKPPTIPKLQILCKKLNVPFQKKWLKSEYVEKCWNIRNEVARVVHDTILEKPPTVKKLKELCTDMGVKYESKWLKKDYVRECWDKRAMIENVAKEILEKPPTIRKLQILCKKLNVPFEKKWLKSEYVEKCWNIRNEVARVVHDTILEKPPTVKKLKELCDELGIEYNSKWLKADYVENCWNVRNNPKEIVKSREASRKKIATRPSMVSVEVPTAVPIDDLKRICRERGIKVKKGWKVTDYMKECFKELPELEDSFSIGKKDKFTGKIKREANFAINNIAALLYLLSKHGSKVCLGINSEMAKKKKFGINEFCDFELCWQFELYTDGTGHYDLGFMIDGTEDDLWDRIKSCKKRFVLIPLYLSGAFRDTKKIAHHNYIIVDKNRRTLERFEPNGYDIDYYHLMRLGIPYLDTFLKDFSAKHKYRYLRPTDFCPAIGPQKLEKLQADETHLEEGGFCTFWNVWYADQRFKYPDVKPDKLLVKLIDQFKKKNVYTELRTFMRNYIAFLEKERKDLIREAKKNERSQ